MMSYGESFPEVVPNWEPGSERNPVRYCKKRGLFNLLNRPVYVKWVLVYIHAQFEPQRYKVEFQTKKQVEHDACLERLKGNYVRIELNEYMPKNRGAIIDG